MKRRLLSVVAGIPSGFGDAFEAEFNRRMPNWRIITRRDLDLHEHYTTPYAKRLYERMAGKLRDLEPAAHEDILKHVNLVLLYLAKDDGSESTLLERFGMEALITRHSPRR